MPNEFNTEYICSHFPSHSYKVNDNCLQSRVKITCLKCRGLTTPCIRISFPGAGHPSLAFSTRIVETPKHDCKQPVHASHIYAKLQCGRPLDSRLSRLLEE